MLKEYKTMLSIMQAYESELKNKFKTYFDKFSISASQYDLILFVKIKCPKEHCEGYGVLSSKNTHQGQIKCSECKTRIDSFIYKRAE